MVENQDFAQARSFLVDINSADEEVSDFVAMQNINLNRLENFTYAPTASDLSTLETIGNKTFPTSSYARSLYRYFTDLKIELMLPDGDDDRSIPRSVERDEAVSVSVFPNPSQGIYQLEYSGIVNGEVAIYSFNGDSVLKKEVSSESNKIHIDLSDQPNGMYFLMIRDKRDGSLIHSEKLVLIK